MVGTKISGLTGGPSYCQPGGAGHASLSSTPLVPRGSSASRREDTALAAHRTPWHSGEHSGLYKILFPIFACSSLVISARGHTPQASNHSMMRLLMEARRSDTECCSTLRHCRVPRSAFSRGVLGSKARRTQPPRAYEYRLNTNRGRRGGGGGEEAGELGPVRSAAGGVGTPPQQERSACGGCWHLCTDSSCK